MTRKLTEHQAELRAILQAVLRQKHPTIYLVGETCRGYGYITSWVNAYAMHKGSLVRLWDPDSMRVRRTDGNYYWRVSEIGTSHTHLLKQEIGWAAGLHSSTGCDFAGKVRASWL